MLMNDEEFLRYLEDVAIDIDTPFDVEKDFERACEIGSQAIELILLRAIEFTDEMMQKIPEESKRDVEQYKKDYELWKLRSTEIDIDSYPEADPYRIIDGESAVQCTESDDDSDSIWGDDGDGIWGDDGDDIWGDDGDDGEKFIIYGQGDERKTDENGRYRWYQRRAGSLYCGLYAIQHLLNDERITKQTLDALSSNTTQLPGVMEADVAEQKSIQSSDLENMNGNYNVNVLSTALNNIGYVTRVLYKLNVNVALVEQFRTDPNVVGIIANRGTAHWYAYRIIEQRQWQECDSINLNQPFPTVTSAAIASAQRVDTLLVVIQPPAVNLAWVPQANRMRLAQLFYEIQNP